MVIQSGFLIPGQSDGALVRSRVFEGEGEGGRGRSTAKHEDCRIFSGHATGSISLQSVDHKRMLRSNEMLSALLDCTYTTSNLPNRSARRRRSRASSLPGGASLSSSTPQTELSEFTGRGIFIISLVDSIDTIDRLDSYHHSSTGRHKCCR